MYRIPVYKVTLVREQSLATAKKVVVSPTDANLLFQQYIGDADREQFVILLLDTRNIVRGINVVTIGNLNSAVVHPREVFKPAILANCAAIIMGHNHPSGDPAPSKEDISLTSRLIQAGELLGIPILDHLILGEDSFISMKDRGFI